MKTLLQAIIEVSQKLAEHASAGGTREYTFDLMVDSQELQGAFKVLAELDERIDGELGRVAEGGCTDPAGHVWNQSAGAADEARVARDWANDRIYCVHCGADGDS